MIEFTCGIDNGFLIWEVNQIEARHLNHRNISFLTESLFSTLFVEASLLNNNSEITCIKSSLSLPDISSQPAYLYIQGMVCYLMKSLHTTG